MRARSSRAPSAAEHCESRTGNFRRTLEVENSEGRAEIDVIPGFEAFRRKVTWLANPAHFSVSRLILTDRN